MYHRHLQRRQPVVTLRPVRPDDAGAMQRFVEALSPVSRRLRFHGALNACTPALLRQLVDVDGVRHRALVACVADDDGERIVGEARCVVDADGWGAEFAIAAAGVGELRGEVLDDNARMQAFMLRQGFAPAFGGDPGVTCWTRPLAPAADALPVSLPSAWELLRGWWRGAADAQAA